MRLEPEAVEAIRAAAAEVLPPGSVVRLFGSRVDDTGRGGDMDLRVQVPEALDARARLRLPVRLTGGPYRRIGEQRMDVVVLAAGQPGRRMDRVARRDGVVLAGGADA